MTKSIELTIPVRGGGYSKVDIFIDHIQWITSVVSGNSAGLTAVMIGGNVTYVEESRTRIKELINEALRDRSDIPAQRTVKKPWWSLG